MPRYAAFLRGVNLAKRRRVSNSDLVEAFEGIGFEDVAAFRTSGNVVFGAPREAEAKLIAKIEKALAASTGFEVTVFLRSAAQVRAIAEQKPFSAQQIDASKRNMQVLLLPKKPGPGARRKVLALATEEDRLKLGDRELYWLPIAGTQDSTLDRKAIEKSIGPTSGRTKSMLEEIAAKFF